MTERARERRVHPNEIDYLGPVAVAQFVDVGWIVQWPMGWTRAGLKALRNGYGTWRGSHQRLLYGPEITEHPQGAAHWEGRRVAVNGR